MMMRWHPLLLQLMQRQRVIWLFQALKAIFMCLRHGGKQNICAERVFKL